MHTDNTLGSEHLCCLPPKLGFDSSAKYVNNCMMCGVLCRTGGLDQDEAPFCQEMVELGVANHGVPERLHPKSFHANFGHNTNVWATRNKQVSNIRGHARLCGGTTLMTPLHSGAHNSVHP